MQTVRCYWSATEKKENKPKESSLCDCYTKSHNAGLIVQQKLNKERHKPLFNRCKQWQINILCYVLCSYSSPVITSDTTASRNEAHQINRHINAFLTVTRQSTVYCTTSGGCSTFKQGKLKAQVGDGVFCLISNMVFNYCLIIYLYKVGLHFVIASAVSKFRFFILTMYYSQ